MISSRSDISSHYVWLSFPFIRSRGHTPTVPPDKPTTTWHGEIFEETWVGYCHWNPPVKSIVTDLNFIFKLKHPQLNRLFLFIKEFSHITCSPPTMYVRNSSPTPSYQPKDLYQLVCSSPLFTWPVTEVDRFKLTDYLKKVKSHRNLLKEENLSTYGYLCPYLYGSVIYVCESSMYSLLRLFLVTRRILLLSKN